MSTEISIWDVSGGSPRLVNTGTTCAESELESWVVKDSSILGEKLLIIGRQGKVKGVGKYDLLAIDADGKLVVIELKRDVTPREAVAQALDYASWLDNVSEEKVREIAADYLGCTLDEAYAKFFEADEEAELELRPNEHRILIVAAALDSVSERIISYLSQRHGVDINAVFFKYCALANGTRLLARTTLVPEGLQNPRHQSSQAREQTLMSLAKERGVSNLVSALRTMERDGYVWMTPGRKSATLRFNHGNDGLFFGAAVEREKFDTPEGSLDVWIRPKKFATATGADEAQIKKILQEDWKTLEQGKKYFIVRLKDVQEAMQLVQQFKAWFGQKAAGASA